MLFSFLLFVFFSERLFISVLPTLSTGKHIQINKWPAQQVRKRQKERNRKKKEKWLQIVATVISLNRKCLKFQWNSSEMLYFFAFFFKLHISCTLTLNDTQTIHICFGRSYYIYFSSLINGNQILKENKKITFYSEQFDWSQAHVQCNSIWTEKNNQALNVEKWGSNGDKHYLCEQNYHSVNLKASKNLNEYLSNSFYYSVLFS